MKTSRQIFFLWVSILGGLVVVSCANSQPPVNGGAAQVVMPNRPQTNYHEVAVKITPSENLVKITNEPAEPIVIPSKSKTEPNGLTNETASSPKRADSNAANDSCASANFSWLWSPKDYWYAIVGAILGAVIGIRWTIYDFEKQKALFRKNCVRQLKTCSEFNLERLRQAKGQLENGIVPNYPLDTVQFNHWITQSYDALPTELAHHLDWQRFQLDHISAKFVVVNSAIVAWAGVPKTAEQLEHHNALASSLALHVDAVLKELPPLLEKLPNA